jgi:microcystin-dependent protein
MLMKRLFATATLASALHLSCAGLASAQEVYIGEIRLFGSNFCPLGWVAAAGQLLPINQNVALFSLYGTTYGGNGTNNFALPNLSGRAPYGIDEKHPLGTAYGASTGGNQAASSTQSPALSLNWCVAVQGMFPSRP